MPTARVHGSRLHYERRGTGEPMLWITGFAISAAVFEPVLPRYTTRFDCLSYDNRGAGRSGRLLRPTSMTELAADAVGLLDVLGVPAAHVYGLSMGGMIAQEVAIRYPDRVLGLILGGTTPGGPRAVRPALAELRALGLAAAPRAGSSTARGRIVASALFSERFRTREPARAAELVGYLGRHRATPVGVSAHWWASVYHDTMSRLPRISAPTLVLHGELDSLCPLGNARLLAQLIGDAELAVVPGAGHAYLLECPAESAALLTGWLDRRGPIAPGRPRSDLARRVEPLVRPFGLPVGAVRAGGSLARLAADRLRHR